MLLLLKIILIEGWKLNHFLAQIISDSDSFSCSFEQSSLLLAEATPSEIVCQNIVRFGGSIKFDCILQQISGKECLC